ncbi:nucleoid-associated protein [Veillonella caviae]|uniref:nucleoid-associated protein n=1 Tax=Veillonella caviae TaxID=248316 RepID=UPI0023A7A527|nr:nucleoid-associated protein [Veillonella caviae]MCI5709313.1 nucleoid-associated protein [Veillonella caviae]MDY5715881.1 nucleoid-associated protein [Veillonella caviae]MDY5788185.1 nucleoid-associated protein [Veillonella caviae]
MQINKAALEIFDFTSSLAVYSEHELNVGDQHIQEYISSHVVKALKDPGARTGILHEGSPMRKRLEAYQNGDVSFVTLAKEIGEKSFDYMKQATEGVVIDSIICEAVTDTTYICILLCQAHDAFTHQLFSEDDGTLATELVPHKAVLPMPSQKLRSFAAINCRDFSVRLFEPKGEYDGESCYILADKVLQFGTDQSSRDTVKKVKSIVDKVAQAHESDGIVELTTAKSMIAKNAEVSDTVDPVRIVEEVFKSNPIQQEAAKKALAEQDMMRPLPVNRDFAVKVGEHHKIKTDTGIEISFPVEYMKNRDFIEIKTNDDGTLRIELKNINKIVNK